MKRQPLDGALRRRIDVPALRGVNVPKSEREQRLTPDRLGCLSALGRGDTVILHFARPGTIGAGLFSFVFFNENRNQPEESKRYPDPWR